MDNYSWLQKKLHYLALSSQFMREAAFDIEKNIETSSFDDNHVFVSGLARSGSTILLNALHKSSEFASLSYLDMPFILSPNLWSKISGNVSKRDIEFHERYHGDGIKVSVESPEAFEEVFWKTFDIRNKETKKDFEKYVNLIVSKYRKKRYLSKNNQNIRRVLSIAEIFPRSKILIPYRDPLQHANSLLNQHIKFINESEQDPFIADYMKLIGHTEFGLNYIPIVDNGLNYEDSMDINHWLEQWYLTYKRSIEEAANKENIYFICYEKLCRSHSYFSKILNLLDIRKGYDFEFKESSKNIDAKLNNSILSSSMNIYEELNNLKLKDNNGDN